MLSTLSKLSKFGKLSKLSYESHERIFICLDSLVSASTLQFSKPNLVRLA